MIGVAPNKPPLQTGHAIDGLLGFRPGYDGLKEDLP
jgi:hypothetical protein